MCYCQVWDKFWQSDIIIEGDLCLQCVVCLMLYYLYFFVCLGIFYSLLFMGLLGLGYNGYVFWDIEIWMYLLLLVMQLGIVEFIMEYCYECLDVVWQNVFLYGYEGVMYFWELVDDGLEDIFVWVFMGLFQYYILGDIVWVCWKYYQVIKDKEWLCE